MGGFKTIFWEKKRKKRKTKNTLKCSCSKINSRNSLQAFSLTIFYIFRRKCIPNGNLNLFHYFPFDSIAVRHLPYPGCYASDENDEDEAKEDRLQMPQSSLLTVLKALRATCYRKGQMYIFRAILRLISAFRGMEDKRWSSLKWIASTKLYTSTYFKGTKYNSKSFFY